MKEHVINVFIFIISIFIFFVLVKIFGYIPKHYHKNIQLIGSLSIIIVISGSFLTYFKEKQESKKRAEKEYTDSILQDFDDIDNILINNYDKFNSSLILDILYNKIQVPGELTNDIHKSLKNMDQKTRNILYVIYGKITRLIEKVYVSNIELFNNENLGIKIRMYIDSMLYYEYWCSTKYSYNKNFVSFMQKKFSFLKHTDYKYFKPDRVVSNIPYMNDITFIYESPKYDKLWYYDNKNNRNDVVNNNYVNTENYVNGINKGNNLTAENSMNNANGANSLYSGYTSNNEYTEYNKM
jgi:hypothetical protein